jgi:uncharacterized protein (TIGR02246 family)
MRRASVGLLLAACVTVPRGHQAEVTALMQHQVNAWNTGDLQGFCASYLDDATFVTPSGVTRGRAEVLARYIKKYGTQRSGMGHLELVPFDVREAEGAVSIAARWTLTWADKPEASGSTVVVFLLTPDGWRIAHDASM